MFYIIKRKDSWKQFYDMILFIDIQKNQSELQPSALGIHSG